MALSPPKAKPGLLVDKDEVRAILDQALAGLIADVDTSVTGLEVQEMLLAQGVRPEDQLASTEILRSR